MIRYLQTTGNLILIIGVIVIILSQLIEITVEHDYANIDIDVAQHLPEKIANIELIAKKINYTLIGGLLIIIGLQLSLVSDETKIIQQWKKNWSQK